MASYNTLALGAGAAHSGTASPGSFFVNDTRSWYDIIVEQEAREEARLLSMSAADWRAEGTRILRTWRGKTIQPCIDYLNRIERMRATVNSRPAVTAPAAVRPRTEFDLDFAIWKDMIEEPAKYGDDICEWLALNEKLTQGSGRWRLNAYWLQVEAEQKAKEEALVAPWRTLYSSIAKEAAFAGERAWIRRDIKRLVDRVRNSVVKIQAAVRGHLVRTKQPFRDCCMCLSHRVCPLKTDAGMMCRECARQGPYEDITGPLDDGWNWFRADFVDLAPAAVGFDPSFLPPTCGWCFATLEDGQPSFCDRDCEFSYMKESWKN
jgi:hypothetical protein